MKLKALSHNNSIGLAICRIIFTIIILKNILTYLLEADFFLGVNGITDYTIYHQDISTGLLKFFEFPFYKSGYPELFLLSLGATAVLFGLGIGGRFAGALLYIGLLVLNARNKFVLNGADTVIKVTLFFLVFSDSFSHFTLRNKSNTRHNATTWRTLTTSIMHFAQLGLQIQICFIYFFSALTKIQGPLWMQGLANYYILHVDEFSQFSWLKYASTNPLFLAATTYGTILWEISFSFLVWFNGIRYPVLLVGVLLHLAIAAFMGIENFSVVMISSYFVFIENKVYVKLYHKYKHAFLLRRFSNTAEKPQVYR